MGKLMAVMTKEEVDNLPTEHANPPPSITGNCTKCGKCCVFFECPLWDTDKKVCLIYDQRPVACRMFPHRQVEIIDVKCLGYTQTGL
jgi:hypothetical protein